MARRLVQMRLDPELLERVDEYAVGRSRSRTAVVEAALRSFLEDASGGVPEFPASESPLALAARARAESFRRREGS